MVTKEMRLVLLLIPLFLFSKAEISSKIGINYGRVGNNLPSPYTTIETIKSMKAGRVKLYDADPETLKILAGTKIRVSIMVSNHEIIKVASNQSSADKWVQDNVLTYYPETMIRFILVGNEVLSYYSEEDQQVWRHLVPAMHRIWKSLKANNIRKIKVGTPLAMDVLETKFLPSSGRFRFDISTTVMLPLLKFLNDTKSFFFVDVYTFFPWSANPTNVSLDFALLDSKAQNLTDPNSGLIYTNLLDQLLDSLIFAMTKLGYPDVPPLISETGWPSAGDIDQPGANIHNAATYNRNVVKRMTASPPIGTPARPGVVIPTFIFALYNENQKTGAGTERHWGLLHPNGTPIYDVDLTGNKLVGEYEPLPTPHNNAPYKGKLWCVVARGADLRQLRRALDYVCSRGNGTCEALTPGRECYQPISVIRHASYAFSSYWAQFRSQGSSCYFNGLAEQTTTNPGHGLCQFPSVNL